VWNQLVFREGWIGPGPGATSQRANFYLPTYGEVDQVQAVVGDPSGMDFIITVNRGSHEIYKPYGPFSGAVPGVAWTNVASPPYGFAQVLERDYLQIDIWEGSSSYWDQPGPPDGSTTVKARVHIINAWAPVPDGWAGTPGYEVSFEGSPFDSIAYDPGPP